MRYDYNMVLLLINKKQKMTHGCEYYPLQNGYLERLNEVIIQNILEEVFCRSFM